jgi:hypothetical protein
MTTDSASASRRVGWLVLGGLHHFIGTAEPAGTDPLVFVPLDKPLDVAFPSNTVVLRWTELGTVELRARTADGSRQRVGEADGSRLFSDMLPSAALNEVVSAVSRGDGPFVPLWYLSAQPTPGGQAVHVYAQIRFLTEDACFIRLTPEPIVVSDVEELTWLPDALRLHAEQFLFLNNHRLYYRKGFDGKELEYKYTLTPPVDIWTVTVRLYQLLRRGGVPGYIVEYRDELQVWDYLNHLFQVTDPEPDRGYVSFIPTTDGKNQVKRKWFAEDAFNRRETHTHGVEAAEGYERYLSEVLGVSAVRLPSFRRVRYDINVESERTGHIYGVFFDHVSLLDAPDVVLHQCEIEYLRSRTAITPDEDAILAEFPTVAEWVEGFLRDQGLDYERSHYSKMSFLRDVVAARPELAVEAR